VGGEEVLRRRRCAFSARALFAAAVWFAAAAAAVWGAAPAAHGEPVKGWRSIIAQIKPPDALRMPDRLTVGVSDELLGQLAPDARHVYFVSNRNATNQIFELDLTQAGATLLFDENADATWPRVSSDGKRLLYVSFRDDAAGGLCVRTLPKLERRCLAGPSAVQAQWAPGGREILLVGRTSLHGDLELMRVDADAHRATPTGVRNVSSPTVSPDGRWLLYVPIERYDERVGVGFAARIAPRLEALRLDRKGAHAPIEFALPGLTGQPAFSNDGKWVYFTQFVDDTNRDGEVDGDDRGVLYRVAWTGGDDAPARAQAAMPEQLTSAAWNCQYPSPAPGQLIATCARGSLDLYSVPLDGAVPKQWTAARLRDELQSSRKRQEHLLLLAHLIAREPPGPARTALMIKLTQLHATVGNYHSAAYEARALARLGDAERRVAAVLDAQVTQRRAQLALESGRLTARFVEDSRARLDGLAVGAEDAPELAALTRIVRSEIADQIGEKAMARRELEAAAGPMLADPHAPPFVLYALGERADDLYRALDDRDALVATYRRLAAHPALDESERLAHARAAVKALKRGRGRAEWLVAVETERAGAAAGGELAFVLELEHWLSRLARDQVPEDVQRAVIDLYVRNPSLPRRRALITIAVARANEAGAEELLEDLVLRWVNDLPKGTTERRRAERMFRQVMEERAYDELADGDLDGAKQDFEAVVARADSLESYVALIEIRLAQGTRAEAVLGEFERRFASSPGSPLPSFVRAYLLARELPALDGDAHKRTLEKALAELSRAVVELKQKCEVQALFGALLHERFLETRQRDAAEEANLHYLLALDLAHENPRYRAMVLEQLGQLQAAVGNFRIALDHLEVRDKLPFASPLTALAHKLTLARALLHVGRDNDAARVADDALALADKTPALEKFVTLAIDRAALYNLSAGKFERAAALYARAQPRLADARGADGERNRLVHRLAHAAAALGAKRPRDALDDLALVDRLLAQPPAALTHLAWPHVPPVDVLASYRMMALGLRARAHRELGELEPCQRALAARRELLLLKLARTNVDEDFEHAAQVEAQLSEVARARGDTALAVRFAEAGLAHAEELRRRTDTPVVQAELDLLAFAVDLYLRGKVPLATFAIDLPGKVQAACDRIAERRNPAWRELGRRFERYAAIFRLDGRAR
jgi:WD40-like Beta Propeller Repeat